MNSTIACGERLKTLMDGGCQTTGDRTTQELRLRTSDDTWHSARQRSQSGEPHSTPVQTSSNHDQIMNCFHLEGHGDVPRTTYSELAVPCTSPPRAGPAPRKRKLTTPNLPLKATETHAYTKIQTHCTYPYRVCQTIHTRLDLRAQRTRIHFTPQHWLLCHMGLY